jgi:hypothetical protein
MFDKVSQAAEKLATNVSRRAFLGRLGQGALATAGVVASMLAFDAVARAEPGLCPRKQTFCGSITGSWMCCPNGWSCTSCLSRPKCCANGGTGCNCYVG